MHLFQLYLWTLAGLFLLVSARMTWHLRWARRLPRTAAEYVAEVAAGSTFPPGPHLVAGPLSHNGPLPCLRHLAIEFMGGTPHYFGEVADIIGPCQLLVRDRGARRRCGHRARRTGPAVKGSVS